MGHFDLIYILAIGFLAALVLGYITHWLRMSPIVGYLLAGFIVGPHSPGFVADANLANQLAEVGVILLMFGVGLHFDLKDLLSVKAIAIPGAILQSLAATALGVAVALAMGLGLSTGLTMGLGLSVASTVVLMRGLEDNAMLDSVHGHVAVGWLIVEDIFTVLVLVLLPAAASMQSGESANLAGAIGMAVLKLAGLWVLVLPVGGRVVPWLLAAVARSRSRELFTLTVLALALAIATGSAAIFGASFALGAFLAGMVVGRSSVSHQAAADILPLRDAFAVLFFISVGMLFEPRFLLDRPGLVLACLGVVLVAKPLVACAVVAVLGYSVRTSLTVAIGLAQVGEFSFILAQQAQALKLMAAEGTSMLVACALISITINPMLFRAIPAIEGWLQRNPALWKLLNAKAERKGEAAAARTKELLDKEEGGPTAIVAGYGPVGRRVAAILRESGWAPTVIDLNIDTVNELAAAGQGAIYGNAGRPEILESAGIAKARGVFVTLPEQSDALAVVGAARQANAGIKIYVRARYVGSRGLLKDLGATAVSFEEEEVAKAMTALAREGMGTRGDGEMTAQ